MKTSAQPPALCKNIPPAYSLTPKPLRRASHRLAHTKNTILLPDEIAKTAMQRTALHHRYNNRVRLPLQRKEREHRLSLHNLAGRTVRHQNDVYTLFQSGNFATVHVIYRNDCHTLIIANNVVDTRLTYFYR